MAANPNDYVDKDLVLASMPDTGIDSQGALVNDLIPRACRLIDKYCKVPSGSFKVTTDEVYYFEGYGASNELVISPLAADPTTVSIATTPGMTYPDDYDDLTTSDYILYPLNAAQLGEPYFKIRLTQESSYFIWPDHPKAARIEGKFGYSESPPDPIIQAAVIQIGRWVKRGLQVWQDTGANVDLGEIQYTQKIDPDLKLLLDDFIRTVI